MDDKTLQAAAALAEKLGTTSEYLFGVLVKQAPITAITDIFVMLALLTGTVIWANIVIRKTTVPEKTETNPYPHADWENDAYVFAFLGLGVLALISIATVVCKFSATVPALLNPEYWAITQILH